MDLLDIEIGPNDYRGVRVPTRFGERFRGLRTERGAMVFETSSVHGFGLKRRLIVVAVGRDSRVTAVRTLEPGRVVVVHGARWLLEMEEGLPRPAVGTPVRFYDRRHGGTTRGVRNSDRESGRHLRPFGRHAPLR